jgi:hypothetical protein
MEPIEKFVKNFEIATDAQKDKAVLGELLQIQADSKRSVSTNMWKTIRFAAVVVAVLSVACWFVIGNISKPKQQITKKNVITVTTEAPAELMSVILLNRAFRDGGIKAVEKQFDIAERKVKTGLKERITIDQLMCELGECAKI